MGGGFMDSLKTRCKIRSIYGAIFEQPFGEKEIMIKNKYREQTGILQRNKVCSTDRSV